MSHLRYVPVGVTVDLNVALMTRLSQLLAVGNAQRTDFLWDLRTLAIRLVFDRLLKREGDLGLILLRNEVGVAL